MSFFKKLFGQNEKKNEDLVDSDIEKFEHHFYQTMNRYLCNPNANANLDVKDERGNKLPLAVAYPQLFNEWKSIRSVWDKRGIIYKFLDNILGSDLELWQVVERFVDDRYPHHALKIANENHKQADLDDANYWVAIAKAQFVLSRYTESEESANKSIKLDPNNRKGKITLADNLHLTNRQNEAHELYEELLKSSKLSEIKEQTNVSLLQIVSFEEQILNSPLYAVNMLHGLPNADENVWDSIAGEFYYSPQFRAQHAYYLLNCNEHLKGLAKLISLSQEMPWYKEGVINAKSVIIQLGHEANMKAEIDRLNIIIQENKWN